MGATDKIARPFNKHVTELTGRFWRSVFFGQEEHLLTPARAPQGRWHHSDQPALYLSGTPEGCRVALKAYQTPDDPPRGIFPIDVHDARVIDLRAAATREALDMPLEDIHVFWATLHKAGNTVPTWQISDRLRGAGVDGILTPSRSRPELTHLTLFRWNRLGGAKVTQTGAPLPF
ncbi:RES family NAD+ phosphorylase [Aliiroseovarius crassostreae]|uniref:RES family NAD+ phosphorylase n=1 Tax=Aliiroseovarius crassostreae TaxID=154981 RepID=UPI003C7BACB4